MFASSTGIRKSALTVLIISFFIAATAHTAATAPSWPQFHGPNRDNISTETGLLKSWPANGPELLWTAKNLGHGFSTVSIASGMIYTAGNIDKDTIITALNANGDILWQVKNGPAWTRDYPGTRGTPTIDADRLYHQSPLGNVICLNAKTGEEIWQLDLLEIFKSKNSKWALCESPIIDGDHVIYCPGGPQTCMVALNKITGSVVWQAPSINELAGYGSPVLAKYQDLRIIITLTAKSIIGVNADSGELLWQVKHESYADENILIPIYQDGQVFVSTLKAGSVKWKINVNQGKASLEELWRTQEMDNHHGGVVLLDGNLYGTSTFRNSKLWICLDWETGAKKYMDKGVGKGSLTVADRMLYTLSEDGLMGLLKPTETGLSLISSFNVPKGGEGKYWPHPVVCDGRLYIRHSDSLYAFAIR